MKCELILSMTLVFASGFPSEAALKKRPEPPGKAAPQLNPPDRPNPPERGSHLSPTQQQNLKQLQTDLGSIKSGSQVTTEQKQALAKSLRAMADGATKPNPALTQQLANDLSQAVADGKLSVPEKMKLSQDLTAVMNSANIPPAEVNQAIADAQVILVASGVTKAEVQKVAADCQAIAAEAKKHVPKK
ncbi:MAG: hypothetical protein HY301_07900 [Verrucomicrobia bacterium]|nr:hypothetical protein [Verrucomicrobiota bacterium]